MEMTADRIAEMTLLINAMEREVRQCHQAAVDPDEKAASLVVLRQTVALRGPLEKWNVVRAVARAKRSA